MKTVIAAIGCGLAMAATPAMATDISAKDYNLFVIGDMTASNSDTEGSVAVGGNATLTGYTVGFEPRGGGRDLVVGGNATLTYGDVHGNTLIGGNAGYTGHGARGSVSVGGNAGFNGGTANGRIVIGGNGNFQNFGVGSSLPGSATNLEVGGNLSFTNGSINGSYIVGGTTTAPSYITNSNPPIAGTVTPPVAPDFAAEGLRLRNLSTTLGAMAATGTVASYQPTPSSELQLTLTGTDAGVNIFSLTAQQMGSWSDFTLNIPVGAVALVNVSGTAAAVVGGGFHYAGGASYNSVLFNFFEATTLGFGDVDFSGSVLAPFATYTPGGIAGNMGGGGGVVNGQMIVGAWNQDGYRNTQVNSRWFSGNLLDVPPPGGGPTVPEPATWALMMLGFGLVGAMARRRGRGLAAACSTSAPARAPDQPAVSSAARIIRSHTATSPASAMARSGSRMVRSTAAASAT